MPAILLIKNWSAIVGIMYKSPRGLSSFRFHRAAKTPPLTNRMATTMSRRNFSRSLTISRKILFLKWELHSLPRGSINFANCPICLRVYESPQLISAHTGVHYMALSTAATAIRLRQKHDKESQNSSSWNLTMAVSLWCL